MAQDETDARLLSPAEIKFLKENCPDSSLVIDSGAAIVHGHVIQPPILVSTVRDKVSLNGVAVFPPTKKPENYLAKKYVDRLHVHYTDEKRRGTKEPLEAILKEAEDLKKAGLIQSYSMLKGDLRRLSITVGSSEAHKAIDYCTGPTSNKRYFIIDQLLWTYSLRKQRDGIEPALAWLRNRFEDLKRMGIINTYRMYDDEETVFTRDDCSLTKSGYGFYAPRTKYAREGEKAWKTKRPESDARRQAILKALNSGKLLIYSHAFEKSLPHDPDILQEVRRMRGGSASANKKKLREKLGLSSEQAAGFWDEIR